MVLSLKGVYGVLVCGFRNASISSNAASVSVSADDKLGMLNVLGVILLCHTPMSLLSLLHIFSSTCNGVVLVQCTILVCHVFPSCCAYMAVKMILPSFQVGDIPPL